MRDSNGFPQVHTDKDLRQVSAPPAPQEHLSGQNPLSADLATVMAAWPSLLPGERRKILAVVHLATKRP